MLDYNDHAPVFLNDNFVTTIGESEPINHKFFTIRTSDKDEGVNSEVTSKRFLSKIRND